MSATLPTVGRVVHYYASVDENGTYLTELVGPFAADIVCVHRESPFGPDTAGLLVKYPKYTHNIEYLAIVPFSVEPKPGHWSWPPRT